MKLDPLDEFLKSIGFFVHDCKLKTCESRTRYFAARRRLKRLIATHGQ